MSIAAMKGALEALESMKKPWQSMMSQPLLMKMRLSHPYAKPSQRQISKSLWRGLSMTNVEVVNQYIGMKTTVLTGTQTCLMPYHFTAAHGIKEKNT